MKLDDVKTQMMTTLGLENTSRDDLVVANVRHNRIDEVFPGSRSCFDIEQDRYERTMIFHVPGISKKESQLIELNFFKMSKRGKNSFSVSSVDRSAPRIFALTKETTIMDVKRLIVEKMRGIFDTVPEDEEALNDLIEVHVRENCPMVKKGMYTRTRA